MQWTNHGAATTLHDTDVQESEVVDRYLDPGSEALYSISRVVTSGTD